MKTAVLLLALLALFDAIAPCTVPGLGCIPRGSFCHAGNYGACCCSDACLGVIIGACFANNRYVSGIMTYSIYDESKNRLLRDTVEIDKTSKVTQENLDQIVARFGNITLYMDAHVDFYSELNITTRSTLGGLDLDTMHKTWRHYKIN